MMAVITGKLIYPIVFALGMLSGLYFEAKLVQKNAGPTIHQEIVLKSVKKGGYVELIPTLEFKEDEDSLKNPLRRKKGIFSIFRKKQKTDGKN